MKSEKYSTEQEENFHGFCAVRALEKRKRDVMM